MTQLVAKILGVVLILVGVLGFVPVLTTDGQLLGIFHVNTLHNIIHLASGAAVLYAGMNSEKLSRMYFKVFGIVYALVTVLGFVYGDKSILGLVANNMADTFLHLAIAAVSLYLGFASKPAPAHQEV